MSQDAPESTTVSFVPHDPVNAARVMAGLLPIPPDPRPHTFATTCKASVAQGPVPAETTEPDEAARLSVTLDAEKIPASASTHERVQELARQRRNLSRTLDVYTEQVAALKDALGVEDFADLRGAVEKLKADLADARRGRDGLFASVITALDTVGAPEHDSLVRRIGLAFSRGLVDQCALGEVDRDLLLSDFGGDLEAVPFRVKEVLGAVRRGHESVTSLLRYADEVRDVLKKAGVIRVRDDARLHEAVSQLVAERDAARAEVERLSQRGLFSLPANGDGPRAGDMQDIASAASAKVMVREQQDIASAAVFAVNLAYGAGTAKLSEDGTRLVITCPVVQPLAKGPFEDVTKAFSTSPLNDKVSLSSRAPAKSKVKKAKKTKPGAESKAEVALRARAEAAAEKKASRRG